MVEICIIMVSSGVQEEHTGIDDDDNERLILEAIQKRKRVPLQTLIRLFAEGTPRIMGESTLKRHLGTLSASKQVGRLKDGKRTIYCVPGESLPEKMPPSGLDLLVLDEMKKLVSDIIASGLLWVDNIPEKEYPERTPSIVMIESDRDKETGEYMSASMTFEGVEQYKAPGESRRTGIAETKDRPLRRYQLAQRAYTLFWAVLRLEDRREYVIPTPRWYLGEDWWYENGQDYIEGMVAENRPDRPVSTAGLEEWLEYYLDAIDILTRELSAPKGEKKPAKARKAASRT